MIYHGIQIDLTFCQFIGKNLNNVTDEDFQNEKNLNQLDSVCARSLSGRNVTLKILSYYKDEKRLKIFKDTLRCIKLFA